MNRLVSSNTKASPRPVLEGIQYLRGICAVIVVISHCNGIIGKPEYYSRMVIPDWHIASVFAVAAFFAISGFIIVIASLNQTVAPRTSRQEFMRRRFVRIIPFLWICTLGYNVLSFAGTSQVDLPSLFRTLALWPVGELKPNVAWSLRHELLFYLFFAFAFMGARLRPRVMFAWLGLSALFYVAVYDLGLVQSDPDSSWFEALKVLMGGDHGANFQFAIGMGLALLFLRHPERLPLGRIPAIVIIALTAAAGIIVTYSPLATGLPDALLWTGLSLPILACALCARPARGWAGSTGLVLGNASFSIYLVHNPVVLILLAVSKKLQWALDTQWQLGAFLGFSIFTAIAAGIVAHYAIEAPLIRVVDRWSRQSRNETARIVNT